MKKSILIFILCLLCGCARQATIPGAKNLADKDLSVIEYLASTFIHSVDGVPLPTNLNFKPQKSLKLTPGQHALIIRYADSRGSIRGEVRLVVTLQPGKRYWLAPTSATQTMKQGDLVGFAIEPMYSGAPRRATNTSDAGDSPVGTWKTVDDTTGKLKSIMQITETHGELQAKILQTLRSDDGPHPLCKKCDGPRKNQPIEGMIVMWGLRKKHEAWDGGHIVDPHNGKVYSVKLQTIEGGTKLVVHGYVGIPMNGRSQTWLREK